MLVAQAQGDRRVQRRRLVAAALPLVLATVSAVLPAAARVIVPAADTPPQMQSLLQRLSLAFETDDHEDLAALLHPDKVRIALGPQLDRENEMTPAQAHYYFKNLFQSRQTVRFGWLKQQLTGAERCHAVAVWHWERTGSGQVGSQRLLVTFGRAAAGDHWRITAIKALRGG